MKSIIRIAIVAFFLTSLCSADQSSSYATTEGFYHWYIEAGNDYRKNFDQARPYFSEELFGLLSEGFKGTPSDDFWVDFDPFIAAQMSADKVSIGKPSTQSSALDMVPVSPIIRGQAPDKPTIKVYLVKQGGKWVIANIAYPGDLPFDLKTWLKDGLGR
jgi:uncharacterized protein DUF3828